MMDTDTFSGASSSANVESTITPEIYFLVSKFLEQGPCQQAAAALRTEIEQHKLMAKRYDWLGNEHERHLSDVERSHPHIRNDHLVKICSRIGQILDKEVPPSIAGVPTLLGDGRQSLLRSKSDLARKPTTAVLAAQLHAAPVSAPTCQTATSNYPYNLVNMLTAREYGGRRSVRQTFSSKLYNKQQMHRRLLGHLSSVYCIAFDRTGNYIFTVCLVVVP